MAAGSDDLSIWHLIFSSAGSSGTGYISGAISNDWLSAEARWFEYSNNSTYSEWIAS